METAKIIRFSALGGPEVLTFEDLPLQEPGPDEVRLKVEAIGLNRAEIMFRTGNYLEQPEFPSRLGAEAAGIIDALGANVTHLHKGQKVSVAPGQSIGRYGTYGQSAIVPSMSAIAYPDNLTPQEAAASWVQYLTAYFAFVDLADVQSGQSVLVTAAAGGAGLGAVQMAKLLGATVIATTRTPSKKNDLLQAGADHVIITNEEDIAARVKDITSGKGADVIFDPIAGSTLPVLAEAVAWGGKIILYGAMGGVETPYPLWTGFARNFALHTYMVYNYCGLATIGLPRNEEAFARATQFILQHLAAGQLKPIIAKTFAFNDMQKAREYMEANQHFGKIVVSI